MPAREAVVRYATAGCLLMLLGCSAAPPLLLPGSEHVLTCPGDQPRVFSISGIRGQYIEIRLRQMGVDLALSLSDPDGTPFLQWDSPTRGYGLELCGFRVDRDGDYRLSIANLDPERAGEFGLQILMLEMDAERARRLKAVAAVAQGEGLRASEPDVAAICFKRAAALWAELGEEEQAAQALWRSANLMEKRVDLAQAVTDFEAILDLLERADADPALSAYAEHCLGVLLSVIGRVEPALLHLDRAERMRRSPDTDRAATLAAMGKTYVFSGSWRQGEALLKEAEEIYVKKGDEAGLASVFAGLGWSFHGRGDYRRAMAYYQRGLELKGGGSEYYKLLTYQALTHLKWGEPRKALAVLDGAEPLLKHGPARLKRIRLDLNRAEARIALKEWDHAEGLLRRNLALVTAGNWPEDHSRIRFNLAKVLRNKGLAGEARSQMERVLSLTDRLAGPSSPRHSAQDHVVSRDLYADLLLELLIETEPAPAREALDLLEGRRAKLNQPALENLLKSEDRRRLIELGAEISRAAWRQRADGEASEVLNRLLWRYETALSEASGAVQAPGGQGENVDLKRIQSRLGRDTGLLYYAMGLDRAWLWVIAEGVAELVPLGNRKELESLVLDYYSQVRKPPAVHGRDDPLGRRLFDLLLKPAQVLIQGKRLVIVADGALHTFPFAALPLVAESGKKITRLAESYELIHLSSLAQIDRFWAIAGERQAGEMLLLAEPLFSGDFPNLSGTGKEADQILTLAGSAGIKVSALRGPGASKKALFAFPALDRIAYLHIATHGLFLASRPELSPLILATRNEQDRAIDGFLPAHEIAGLKLMNRPLVVLSACETALNKNVETRGWSGFPAAFLRAGASAVIVSLWRVDDEATATVMTAFYRALWRDGLQPAAALRRAQSAMIGHERWSDPYYWAGFVYQGGWWK